MYGLLLSKNPRDRARLLKSVLFLKLLQHAAKLTFNTNRAGHRGIASVSEGYRVRCWALTWGVRRPAEDVGQGDEGEEAWGRLRLFCTGSFLLSFLFFLSLSRSVDCQQENGVPRFDSQ